MKGDLKSPARAKEGGRGSAGGVGAEPTTGQLPSEKFSQIFTAKELTFLLSLLGGHRSYYRMLSRTGLMSSENRGRGERIEALAAKLEKMVGAADRDGASASVNGARSVF